MGCLTPGLEGTNEASLAGNHGELWLVIHFGPEIQEHAADDLLRGLVVEHFDLNL